jgi:hypothetical protein
VELELSLDERRHMDRLHLSKIPYVVLGTNGGELPDGLPAGSAGVKKTALHGRQPVHDLEWWFPYLRGCVPEVVDRQQDLQWSGGERHDLPREMLTLGQFF